jgi:hypothetical protein
MHRIGIRGNISYLLKPTQPFHNVVRLLSQDNRMSAECEGPSRRLAYRLLLSYRSKSLLDDSVNICRIRHDISSDRVLILLGEKQEHPILEILLRCG